MESATEPMRVGFESSDVANTHPAGNVKAPKIVLSEEQAQILRRVKHGHNVFFTGSAGTGKSVLLREIVAFFRTTRRTIAITASTGIASINIGGCTLHSWAGINRGEQTVDRLSGKILGTQWLRERWRSVDCLIIDEISMIDGALFDKLRLPK
ncbi:PIF1-like helicase-domain-containing protein [Gloeopeniophorella convolvens]|nr:PIF1-like helicase-domain-containing protein [Gloeopeniophorella convolvens]